MANGANRGAAHLADALGNADGNGEYLFALLVEQQVVVAEMRSAHVPVEILGFEIKRKKIGQQGVQNAGYILHLLGVEPVWDARFGCLGTFRCVCRHSAKLLYRGKGDAKSEMRADNPRSHLDAECRQEVPLQFRRSRNSDRRGDSDERFSGCAHCQAAHLVWSHGDGVRLRPLFTRSVTPRCSNRANSIRPCSLDIVAAITDHPARSCFQAAVAHQSGKQVRLAVAQVFSPVAIDCLKAPGKFEEIKDAHREMMMLGGADVKRESLALEPSKHFPDSGIDGVLIPSLASVAGAVILGKLGACLLCATWHQLGNPLFNRRTHEALQRPLNNQAMSLKNLPQAGDNSWFGVSERSVEIKDE